MDGGSTGNKFRKGLVGDVEKKISYEEGQKALRDKYKIKEDVVMKIGAKKSEVFVAKIKNEIKKYSYILKWH